MWCVQAGNCRVSWFSTMRSDTEIDCVCEWVAAQSAQDREWNAPHVLEQGIAKLQGLDFPRQATSWVLLLLWNDCVDEGTRHRDTDAQ